MIYTAAKDILDGRVDSSDFVVRRGHELYPEYLKALRELVDVFETDGRFAERIV